MGSIQNAWVFQILENIISEKTCYTSFYIQILLTWNFNKATHIAVNRRQLGVITECVNFLNSSIQFALSLISKLFLFLFNRYLNKKIYLLYVYTFKSWEKVNTENY